MKFRKTTNHRKGLPDFTFYCPGCECDHGVWTTDRNDQGAIWSFNGDMERPTVSPSLLIRWSYGGDQVQHRCHIFIRDGKIQFLTDCTHALAGQTLELQNID